MHFFFKKRKMKKCPWFGFEDWWKSCQSRDGMGKAGMHFLWITAKISPALSVLQRAFTNTISFCRLCRLDRTRGHELQHCSTWESSLGGFSVSDEPPAVLGGRLPLIGKPLTSGSAVVVGSAHVLITISPWAWHVAPPHPSPTKSEVLLNHLHVMN